MNICINIYGKPQFTEYLEHTLKNLLIDKHHTYHILYTTWTTEDTSFLSNTFPEAYIRQVEIPNSSVFDSDLLQSYKLDVTQRPGKTMLYWLLGYYVRYKSADTILEYETKHNITFDMILTIRTYTKINRPIQEFYNQIKDGNVYVADRIKFQIYNEPAFPNTIVISNRNVGIDILNYFDIFKQAALENTTIFHPETSEYKMIKLKQYNIVSLPFEAYIYE
jgi:hypothetical protein